MGHAIQVEVDGEQQFIAMISEGGAVGCHLTVAAEGTLRCTGVSESREVRRWPPVRLSLGNVVTIKVVSVLVGDSPMVPELAQAHPTERGRADALAAAEEMLPPPTIFRCLRVKWGPLSVLSGVRRGALSLTVGLSQWGGRAYGSLVLTGLDTDDQVHRRWLLLPLQLDEVVTAELLEAGEIDRPAVTMPAPRRPARPS